MDPKKLADYLQSRSTSQDVIEGAIALLAAESPKTSGRIQELEKLNRDLADNCSKTLATLAKANTALAESLTAQADTLAKYAASPVPAAAA